MNHFVNALAIRRWAEQISARSTLPHLCRKLVHATVNDASEVDFPVHESVQRAGFDGQVVCNVGNAWVPPGRSGWELSTEKDVIETAVTCLAGHDRIRAAVDVLGMALHNKKAISIETIFLRLEALLKLPASKFNEQLSSVEPHDICDVIEAMQQKEGIDEDRLVALEWHFLSVLDNRSGHAPKALQRKLCEQASAQAARQHHAFQLSHSVPPAPRRRRQFRPSLNNPRGFAKIHTHRFWPSLAPRGDESRERRLSRKAEERTTALGLLPRGLGFGTTCSTACRYAPRQLGERHLLGLGC
jgi:hypothetical protein